MIALKSLWSKCGYLFTQIVTPCSTLVHLLSSVAPSCVLAQSVICSVCLLTVVTLLLLCLQFAFWMISWGYQTFLKETLSINIFLILNFAIRGPCLNLCQSERKLITEARKVIKRIWAKTILMKVNFAFWFLLTSCDIRDAHDTATTPLHIFPSAKSHSLNEESKMRC